MSVVVVVELVVGGGDGDGGDGDGGGGGGGGVQPRSKLKNNVLLPFSKTVKTCLISLTIYHNLQTKINRNQAEQKAWPFSCAEDIFCLELLSLTSLLQFLSRVKHCHSYTGVLLFPNIYMA